MDNQTKTTLHPVIQT
jgi:hypothetical protein